MTGKEGREGQPDGAATPNEAQQTVYIEPKRTPGRVAQLRNSGKIINNRARA